MSGIARKATRSRQVISAGKRRARKEVGASVWGVKLWNALPVNIKEIRCLYTLKLKSKHTYYLTTMSKIIKKSCDYVV